MGHAWLDFHIYQEFDPVFLSPPPRKALSLHPTPLHFSSCEATWMIIRVSSETHFPLSLINPLKKKEISALGHRQATCKQVPPPSIFITVKDSLNCPGQK
uniref:Uncharacterized protein n=1 Tax=Micrurus corallinus TaxID=54390 RepID=A0A2D4FID7_MICCO